MFLGIHQLCASIRMILPIFVLILRDGERLMEGGSLQFTSHVIHNFEILPNKIMFVRAITPSVEGHFESPTKLLLPGISVG
jgi:hypothetical protein